MGIIIRQSIWISIFSYVGILLGYVNVVLLFPQFLAVEQIGSVRFIQGASALFVQFAQVGIAPSLLRYYPIFAQRFPNITGLVPSLLLASVVAFGGFLLVFLAVEDHIWAYFSDNAPQTRDYAGLILMLVFVMSLQAVMEAYSRSILEAVVVNVLRDVGLRVMTTLIIMGYALAWYDFTVFLWLTVSLYGINLGLLTAYLGLKGKLQFSTDFSFWRRVNVREVVYFSLSSFLGGSGSNIFRRVDSFMVTSMLGLFANGVYTTMFNIALVIEVPMSAIAQISQPIIAHLFATNDMKNIAMIYKKSLINQQLAGSLIFIGIWANLDNLFAIMPNGEAFRQGYWVAVLVGLSKLVDMTTGSNNEIINMSQFYRFNMYMMLSLAGFSIATNWLLIPYFGMEGAALATLLTIVVFNGVKLAFIYAKYRILPFSQKNVWLLIITAGVLYLALRIDPIGSAWLDIPVRSLGITVLFGGLVVALRISEDANQLLRMVLRRAKLY